MNHLTHSLMLTLSGLFLTLSNHAGAQSGEERGSSEIRISLVAIGNPPQPRFEIRDDRRHLVDTPVSEYPPPEIVLRESRRNTERFRSVPLGLNAPTGTILYRGGRTLDLFRDDQGASRSGFVSLTLPETRNDLTVFLTRNRSSKSWEREPQAHYFDNGLSAFPNDSVRVINLSSVPIRTRINDGRVFQVRAGGSNVVRITRKDQGILAYQIAAVLGEEVFPLIDTATTAMPDTRFNLVVYNSDSSDARAPVDLTSYFERPLREDPDFE